MTRLYYYLNTPMTAEQYKELTGKEPPPLPELPEYTDEERIALKQLGDRMFAILADPEEFSKLGVKFEGIRG